MRKLRNKKFSLLMALIFAFTTMFSFAGSALAASTSYDALSIPTVEESDDSSDVKDLGSLLITIDRLDSTRTHEALISLPSDFEHNKSNGFLDAEVDGTTVSNAVYLTTTSKDNEFKIDLRGLAGTTLLSDVEILIPFNGVYVEGDDGDIVATIEEIRGQLIDGEEVIGYISGGDVTVSVVDDETFDDTGNVTIRVKESLAGALGDEDDALTFELPDGFVWDLNDTGNIDVDVIYGDPNFPASLPYSANDEEIDIEGYDTDEATCFEITLPIEVEDYGTEEGDIIAKVRGDAGATPNELVVGAYGDYGVDVTPADAEEVIAGQYDQAIADIDIEEALDGSLVEGRSIFIELPEYAAWVDAYVPDDSDVLDAFEMVGDNAQLIRAKVKEAGDVTLEDAKIMVEAGAPEGELEVNIYGSAIGEELTLVVANLIAPVKVSTDPAEVRIGMKKQATGDVTITEVAAGTLIEDGILVLALPQGAEFSAVPASVEVVEGDLKITNVVEADRFLRMTIDRDSDEASTIKISGILLDVDRTLAEGTIGFKVMGTAVVEEETIDEWANSNYAAVGAIANCVTPAPGETMKTAVFVLGSTNYTVDGTEYTMDVASYAKQGRTYLPLRYVSMALGVDESNILYDSASQTVTLLKGDKVVQVTIGSKSMVVNGAAVAMDVAPEAVDGRTMLPFRWISWAFGASVDWDAETQTVTMQL